MIAQPLSFGRQALPARSKAPLLKSLFSGALTRVRLPMPVQRPVPIFARRAVRQWPMGFPSLGQNVLNLEGVKVEGQNRLALGLRALVVLFNGAQDHQDADTLDIVVKLLAQPIELESVIIRPAICTIGCSCQCLDYCGRSGAHPQAVS